jgi:hypothetical protein
LQWYCRFLFLQGGAGDDTLTSTLGSYFLKFIFVLIFTTVTIAIVSTEPVVKANTRVMDALDWTEGAAVIVFTLEYLARLYASPEDPSVRERQTRCSGTALCGSAFGGATGARILFVFSFFSFVDLLAIVPW